MSNGTYTHQRPIGVTVIVVLLWIEAIVGIVGGIYLMIAHNQADLINELDRSGDTILAYGIAALVIGLVTALVASALGRGSNFARWLVAIITLLNLISAVYSFFALDGVTRSSAIVSAIIAVVVLYFLFGEKGSEEFFES
jgi:uncharacterized membrane protein YjdF